MKESKLYQIAQSETNIFSAIYSLESYIFEKQLLNDKDLDLYYKLKDKYDGKVISDIIKACKEKLEKILDTDDKFEIQVFYRAKKYENKQVEYRPMHTADLITQICIVSLLNVIMFSINQDSKRQLSDLSQLLPSNFYGNLPSSDYENIFYDWKVKYKEYTDDVMKSYEAISKNKTYKYEVDLDLVKFFPSVDPNFIYNFILEKVSPLYTDDEKKDFEKILKKLLYFRVSNLKTQEEVEEYLKPLENKNQKEGIFKECIGNIGIPQGLPQAYFFGNIAMIPISKEFNKMFPGESFYYVDDSVIYTNSEKANPLYFKQSLEELNGNIESRLLQYRGSNIQEENAINYKIKVHEENKSHSAEVESAIKMGKSFLVGVGLEASRTSFEINTTTNELQDFSMQEKIMNIYEALEDEICNVKQHIETIKIEQKAVEEDIFRIYLKSLIRYKKFFGYRKRILEFRQLGDISEIKKSFEEKYLSKKLETPEDYEDLFECFDEDIFLPEATLILRELPNDEKKVFYEDLIDFEKRLNGNLFEKTLYFGECFSNKSIFADCSFVALNQISSIYLGSFTRKPEDIIIKKLGLILSNEDSIWIGFNKNNSYNNTIFQFSNTYKRNLLNSYISTIFNIEVSNNIEFIKLDKRPLKYYELRILLYIRNKSVEIKDFEAFLKLILNDIHEKNYQKVDFSLIEVLTIFKTYVRSAELIDNLILVHKYVSSVWKNGSRFLYFYTLHNQEHSVELIKSSVNICKTFDFLQIKSMDYYVLFLACYLHDISMILQPSSDRFLESNAQTDEIYSSFLKFKSEIFTDTDVDEFHFENKSNVKLVMRKAFEQLNCYYESISRDAHVAASASFIKSASDLDFIGLPIRAIVAAISAAHGAEPIDVYGLRSSAKSDIISEKYMMMILRVADLLDIAKDRVSLDILDRNVGNMPLTSQYHWITHSAVDKFEIKSKYTYKEQDSIGNEFTSVLKRENFMETIIVEIYLNSANLTNVKKLDCKDVSATLNRDKEFIEIQIGKGNECNGECNFLCKWICHKNAYLLPELNALQRYIERTPNLNFATEIKIKLNFTKAKALKNEYFDIVNEQIQ